MEGESIISHFIDKFLSEKSEPGSEEQFQSRSLVVAAIVVALTGLVVFAAIVLSGLPIDGEGILILCLLVAVGAVPFVLKFYDDSRFASVLFVILFSALTATLAIFAAPISIAGISALFVTPVFAVFLLGLRYGVACLIFAIITSVMILFPEPTLQNSVELIAAASLVLSLTVLDGLAISFICFVRRARSRSEESEENSRVHQARLAHMTRLSTVGEMASGIAHELNQPLTAITGYVDGSAHRLRASGEASPEILSALKKASDQAMRAGEVIRRIRHFVSQSDERREAIDVNRAVGEIIEMLEFEANRNNISIRTELATSLPTVEASIIQIQQVILNLARNGLEAMSLAKTDAGAVEISTSEGNNSEIRVMIQDTGPGLSHQSRSHLFEPFYTTKEGGLGMGLSICQSIIEQHGGEIWAETRESHGAAFCFTLPVMKEGHYVDA